MCLVWCYNLDLLHGILLNYNRGKLSTAKITVSKCVSDEHPSATYLFILVCSDGNKFCFFEDVRPELAVRKLQNVVCSN